MDGRGERLPATSGGLIELALTAWAARAPLFLALGLAVALLCGAIDVFWVTAPDDADALEVKGETMVIVETLALAFVVTVAAIALRARLLGEALPVPALLERARLRWLPVAGIAVFIQLIVDLTSPLNAFGPLPEPRALTLILAPLLWLVYGIFALAEPIAALSDELPLFAMFTGIAGSIRISLRRENFARLCLVALITIAPTLGESVLYDQLARANAPHVLFWANLPIDAITVAPIAAIQAAFVLDFARRGGQRAA